MDTYFKYSSLPDKPLWQGFTRKFPSRLNLFIPISCLTRNMLFIAKTSGKC